MYRAYWNIEQIKSREPVIYRDDLELLAEFCNKEFTNLADIKKELDKITNCQFGYIVNSNSYSLFHENSGCTILIIKEIT